VRALSEITMKRMKTFQVRLDGIEKNISIGNLHIVRPNYAEKTIDLNEKEKEMELNFLSHQIQSQN
jgi:hypothetical protein